MNKRLFFSNPTSRPLKNYPLSITNFPYLRWKHCLCLVIVLTMLCTRNLFAQEAGTAGLMIEDSQVLGRGAVEVATVYADRVLHASYGLIVVPPEGYTERSQGLSLGVAYGLTDGIDVMGELQWNSDYSAGRTPESIRSFGDIRLGVKMHLWQPAEQWTVSWVQSVVIPALATTDNEAGGSVFGMDQLVVLSGSSGPLATTLQAGVHSGYTTAPDPWLHLHLAGGIGYQVSRIMQPRLELHFEDAPLAGHGHSAATVLIGVACSVMEQLRLDIGVHALALGDHAWEDRTMLLRMVFVP